jgi:hypothetical protein
LINAGSITVDPLTVLSVSGGFTVAGGTNAGDLWVRGGPHVQGVLTMPSGQMNHGTIRLETTESTWSSGIVVQDSLAAAGTLTNASDGQLHVRTGTGGPRSLNGNLVNAGELEPGYPSSLLVQGNYTQTASGAFRCLFAGAAIGEFSRLTVQGTATLSGAISAKRLQGYNPNSGLLHAVLNATSRLGTFTILQSCDGIQLAYTATEAQLAFTTVSGVMADLTGDGMVDGADLGFLLGAWGICGECCLADFNSDGTVDGADLGTLLGSWS